jgi:hypothetical protein
VLALKLVLVPGFLLAISLVGRRWGPAVAGWLAGLPVVAGPILVFIALEQGRDFAAAAASGAVAAVAATAAFIVAYVHGCRRAPWPTALGLGLAAWIAVAAALAPAPLPAGAALAIGVAALVATPRLVPNVRGRPGAHETSRRELAVRMVAGAALTFGVTLVAGAVGPRWSGLLSVFPVLASVLAVFTHRAHGPEFTTALLRSMAGGMYSLLAFCFVVAVALPRVATAAAFAVATAATLAVLAATKRRA